MYLLNVYQPDKQAICNIHITGNNIASISHTDNVADSNDIMLDFDGAMIFPGFINSHDHIDFNLFPQLGNRIYANYTEWGKDIHATHKPEIDHVLKVPESLRIRWGLFKNLLNGFTTVVNHGKRLKIEDDWIHVIQDLHILHSPAFEKNWPWKLNRPFAGQKPFVMHIGEGTDERSAKEIDEVVRWNILKRRIIAVHGVSMNEKQAEHFAGLVWCPATNLFLLGKTAAIDQLKTKTKVVFGSDSTLTSSWNIWDQIRAGMKTKMMSEDEMINSITIDAAELWNLSDRGQILAGKKADLVVFKKKETFSRLKPEDILIVLTDGQIRMFDGSIAAQIKNKNDFDLVELGNSAKYVCGKICQLIKELRSFDIQLPINTA